MRLLNQIPSRAVRPLLIILPFLAVLAMYWIASEIRLAANPQDKILPSPATIISTAERLMTEGDRRTGRILFWYDTAISLQRLAIGVGLASLTGLIFGLLIGLIPYARTTLSGFVAFASMVPPLALLPILFIVFGLGEVSKIMLIYIGITPFLVRDLASRTVEIPHEQIVKAQTLGASTGVIALRVALPQLLPRLLQAIRLALGPAWLFLIAAEAIAATDGLGYRIFLVRRYMSMDVILPYVAWITLLAFLFDWLLATLSRRLFPWNAQGAH